MKEGFFSKIRDSVKNAVSFQDDEGYYDEDEYEEEDEPLISDTSAPEPAKHTPNPGFQTPDYVPYGTQFSAPQPKVSPAPKFKTSKKSNSNIYAMPDMKKSGKLKISLFVLNDTDDARNVADSMIDRGIVVICDMSKLSVAEERRVLDFLDGVKYVCNSIIENISEHIYLIVPEAAELSGDFFSQVDY